VHLEILLDAQEDTSSGPGNTSRCRGSKNTFAKAPAISATTIAGIAIEATVTPIATANIAAKFVAATPIGSRKWQLLTHYCLRVPVGTCCCSCNYRSYNYFRYNYCSYILNNCNINADTATVCTWSIATAIVLVLAKILPPSTLSVYCLIFHMLRKDLLRIENDIFLMCYNIAIFGKEFVSFVIPK